MKKTFSIIAALALMFESALAGQSYYENPEAIFSMRPDPSKSLTHITNFGPVGMSLDLIKPNFTIRIKTIEPGSPAEQTGQLAPGMIIESINGETLAAIDPRIQLGNIISKAEAADGKLRMEVADKPGAPTRQVTVQLNPLGSYSPSWPMDCPKSEKIVRNYAEYLKSEGAEQGFGSLGMLFLLSTGDDSDLAHVRQWARSRPKEVKHGFHTWNAGYGNLALAEYYLRTGDKEVLPAIQAVVDNALSAENNGAWGNRAPITNLNYGGGGGHLNAGSVALLQFLILAKECGAEMPEEDFLRVLRHFYRWAGRGNVSYGDGKPELGYVDNGKNGKLAFAMALAADLSPKKDRSIYARASEVMADFSFYSTSYMLHGHTGGGIGEIWRSAAMGLMHEKQPEKYRSFMDERRWHYEMSRRFDGSFNILGGERYDNNSWGAGYAWTYTVPRKTLRMTGAPTSPYAVPYDLPEHLWGTAADEDFLDFRPIPYADGTRPVFAENLREGAAMALLEKRKGSLTDDELRKYLRHPEISTRHYFLDQVAKRELAFVLEMLGDPDARMRQVGLVAVVRNPEKFLNASTIEIAVGMLADDAESWSVKTSALDLLARADVDTIVAHIDRILPYLEHEEWWLQHSALEALTTVVADKRVYKKVLPEIGKLLETNHTYNLTAPLRWGQMPKYLREAEPEVAAFAREVLKEAYTNFVEYEHPYDAVTDRINPGMREDIATFLTNVPGGYDLLFRVAKERDPNAPLPYEDIFLEADSSNFSPELKKAVAEIVKKRVIPRFIAENRKKLLSERENEVFKGAWGYGRPKLLDLVELYQQIGVNDYDWKVFGPQPDTIQWRYFSFDPPEALPWDSSKPRFREVTFPEGMENWYAPSFDAKGKGWSLGSQPFGAKNGELVSAARGTCRLDFCRCHLPMKTLWEKEVLLLRSQITFPEMKDGHRYRLIIGGMSHVGAGEGYQIYINGKPFADRERKVDRRQGAKPIGQHIDKSWWPEVSGQTVDVAVVSFMGIHRGVKSRHMSLWAQEMKLPDVSDEAMIRSASALPMTSSAWQALQDLDDNDLDPEVGKFNWDGQFVTNSEIVGEWESIGITPDPASFDSEARPDRRNIRLKQLNLLPGGKTNQRFFIHSGNVLMNLERNEALQMKLKTFDGTDYLFVEQGDFATKRGKDWRPNWEVLTRK